MKKKIINVVAAIIIDEGKLFATCRGYGEWKGWWEFPGGKIEADESPQEALKREIREELATEIEVEKLLDTIEYDYPKFHLCMRCYLCSVISGELTLLEHASSRRLSAGELNTVKWLPADLQILPLIANLLKS